MGIQKRMVTRRDFLKLVGLFPLSVSVPKLVNKIDLRGDRPNVIIVVFDALSAYHTSLNGYQRNTMPNLTNLAERAVVYHRHYAGGNFTSPGTATLLTGTLPWRHRAFNHSGTVDQAYISRNIFRAFQEYTQVTYTHNPWAGYILNQFHQDIDELIPVEKLLLTEDYFIQKVFEKDEDTASVGWNRTIKTRDEGYAYSLFLSRIYRQIRDKQIEKFFPSYPRGVPHNNIDNYFLLEDAVDFIGDRLAISSQPFLGYFHFLPPHDPYNTHQEFYGRFGSDGLKIFPKPVHILTEHTFPFHRVIRDRMEYDEYILYADRELGRFFQILERNGLLENTWIILTSDHGELFERGIIGHNTALLYEPVIRIPLVIFEPGRQSRLDVRVPTSATDLLPTLLKVTGQSPSDWSEGKILPPYDAPSSAHEDRSIYALEAKKNEKFAPLSIATTAMIKGGYKLLYFSGYRELAGKEKVELYDVENDPEEMDNLYSKKTATAKELLHELKVKLAAENEPFQAGNERKYFAYK
jgi:arylsulfatase A-like enzyme